MPVKPSNSLEPEQPNSIEQTEKIDAEPNPPNAVPDKHAGQPGEKEINDIFNNISLQIKDSQNTEPLPEPTARATTTSLNRNELEDTNDRIKEMRQALIKVIAEELNLKKLQ